MTSSSATGKIRARGRTVSPGSISWSASSAATARAPSAPASSSRPTGSWRNNARTTVPRRVGATRRSATATSSDSLLQASSPTMSEIRCSVYPTRRRAEPSTEAAPVSRFGKATERATYSPDRRAPQKHSARLSPARAVSSVGRAPARQAGGHWFEPSTAHQKAPHRGFFVASANNDWQEQALPLCSVGPRERDRNRVQASLGLDLLLRERDREFQ